MIHLPFTLWTAWLAVLLAARSGLVRFPPSVPPLGIRNYCSWIGYPKAQDYFWFAAAVASGFIAVFLADRVRKIAAARGWCGAVQGLPLAAGGACLAMATILALGPFPFRLGLAPVLAVIGTFLPWFDHSWYEARPVGKVRPWAPRGTGAILTGVLAAAFTAFVFVYDPCRSLIPIDGYHEGSHLLLVQQALSDGFGAVAFRSAYGPLYSLSLLKWMQAFGMTVSAERGYFLMAQVSGCAILLLLVILCCRRAAAVLAGCWLMLALSSATFAGYGWANSLRTALPLAAVWMCWEGLRKPSHLLVAGSGLLVSAGILYSAEYGIAGLVVMAAVMTRSPERPVWLRNSWSAIFLAGFLVILVVLSGGGYGGYVTKRLLGHTGLPLPGLPNVEAGVGEWFRTILVLAALWLPALSCVAMSCWLALRWRDLDDRRSLAFALVVFTMLAQVPVLARPMSQIGGSMPPAVLLLAVWLDMAPGRSPARIAGAGLAIFAAVVAYPDFAIVARQRLACLSVPGFPAVGGGRLGSVVITDPETDRQTRRALMIIAENCPPGRPVYLAAPFWLHLAFLADRPGLSPLLSTALVVTEKDRRTVLESLELQKPPVALVTMQGIDVPYEWEHPEEWAYVRKHYRLKVRLDDLLIYVRR
jgi:hypothetical protein